MIQTRRKPLRLPFFTYLVPFLCFFLIGINNVEAQVSVGTVDLEFSLIGNIEEWGYEKVEKLGGGGIDPTTGEGKFYIAIRPTDPSVRTFALSLRLPVAVDSSVTINSMFINTAYVNTVDAAGAHVLSTLLDTENATVEAGRIMDIYSLDVTVLESSAANAESTYPVEYDPLIVGTNDFTKDGLFLLVEVQYTSSKKDASSDVIIAKLVDSYTDSRVISTPFGDFTTSVELPLIDSEYVDPNDNTPKLFSLAKPVISSQELPLPVEFLSFNAEVKGVGVLNTWETANEINNDYFIVQRSTSPTDGFIDVSGEIDGYGNSNTVRKYTFFDETLTESGIYYYRIKQVDF